MGRPPLTQINHSSTGWLARLALPVAERQGYLGLRPCPKSDDGNDCLATTASRRLAS